MNNRGCLINTFRTARTLFGDNLLGLSAEYFLQFSKGYGVNHGGRQGFVDAEALFVPFGLS